MEINKYDIYQDITLKKVKTKNINKINSITVVNNKYIISVIRKQFLKIEDANTNLYCIINKMRFNLFNNTISS